MRGKIRQRSRLRRRRYEVELVLTVDDLGRLWHCNGYGACRMMHHEVGEKICEKKKEKKVKKQAKNFAIASICLSILR